MNPSPIKFQPQLANVAGVPQTIATVGSAANLQSRTFWGAGPPSATTLKAGPQVTNAAAMYVAGVYAGAGVGVSAPDMYFDVAGLALWICTTGGTNNVGGSGGSVWQQISGGGGSSAALTPMLIQQLYNADYFQANPVLESGVYGNPVYVAKAPMLYPSIGQYNYIDPTTKSVTIVTYTNQVDNQRTATVAGGSSQIEVMVPEYIVQGESSQAYSSQAMVWAAKIPLDNKNQPGIYVPTPDGKYATYIEVLPARMWARAVNQ